MLTASGEICDLSLETDVGGCEADLGGGGPLLRGTTSLDVGGATNPSAVTELGTALGGEPAETAGGGPYGEGGMGLDGDAVAANGLTFEGGS